MSQRRVLRDNGLSIVLFALFFIFLIGQIWAGWIDENNELADHGRPSITVAQYLTSGSFAEVTTENWESEFLQMFAYVLFTVFLFQRGSAESKSPDEPEDVDRDPRLSTHKESVPNPVRRGGFALRVYENSLGITFFALFLLAFTLHALGGTSKYNEEALMHGGETITVFAYLRTARFWFESFQNWQSEFLAIGSMVVLSIFLRQRGSPESKPVDSPHSQTGT